MSNITVTGGAGYIGSVLVPQLLSLGHKVTVLDNFYFNQNSLMECCANPDFRIIRGDSRCKDDLTEAINEADVIIPLAALVGFPLCRKDPIGATSTNLEAIKLLLSLRKQEQKIIFPCTNSGYGLGEGEKFCTEDSPINPISLYGTTKLEAEKEILKSGNCVCFRFATLFGASPRMRTDLLVNDFVYRAVFDKSTIIFEGSFKRNFLHVRDAANAFIFALNNFNTMNGRTYNCGLSEANLSKLELCERIAQHIPGFTYLEAEVGEDPDKRNYIVSNSRLEAIGWKPVYTLDDGIEELKKVFTIIKNNKYSNI